MEGQGPEQESQQQTVAALSAKCRQQEKDKRSGGLLPWEDACLKLFQRAVQEKCQEAWKAIYVQYNGQMRRWARSAHSPEDVIQRAIEKFFQRMEEHPETFAHLGSLAQVLGYLKMCVRSVLVDQHREAERAQREMELWRTSVPSRSPSSESQVLNPLVRQQCAAHIYASLKDDEERLVIQLNFDLGLKPSEIVARHPERFPTVRDVYRIRDRVVHRLAHDPFLRSLWADYLEKSA